MNHDDYQAAYLEIRRQLWRSQASVNRWRNVCWTVAVLCLAIGLGLIALIVL